MPLCEMCGKESHLVTVNVEGVELNVCSGCAKHGKIKRRVFPTKTASSHSAFGQKSTQREKPEYKIVSNYSSLIRQAREKRGMKQEDFAKSLNERESLVAKWESGTLKPRIDIARKVGSILGINLVEEDTEVAAKIETSKKSDEFTLGDFVKVRKRK